LLVRHVITVGRLFVKLGQTVRCLLEAVLQMLQVNISTCGLRTLMHLLLLGVYQGGARLLGRYAVGLLVQIELWLLLWKGLSLTLQLLSLLLNGRS
jgi:hypothetical protein